MCGSVSAVSPAAYIASLLLGRLRKRPDDDSVGNNMLHSPRVEHIRTAVHAAELGQHRPNIQREIFKQLDAPPSRLKVIGNGGRLKPDVFCTDAASLLVGIRPRTGPDLRH